MPGVETAQFGPFRIDADPAGKPPLLLVNGTYERGFRPMRDMAARALPSMKIVDLKGGYSINIEQADAVNTAVLDFFAAAKHAG